MAQGGGLKLKRKKAFAANAASTKKLIAEGWTVGKVDQSINTGKFVFTRDLFGFADLLAMSPSRGVLLVQATADKSTSNFHARVSKLKAEPRHAIALASGIRIQVHSWEGSGSKRKCRVLEITSPAPTGPAPASEAR